MKALGLLLFGIFLTVSSAYGQKTCTIEGDIQNMPDSITLSCAEMKGNTARMQGDDFFTMTNGKFKITREVDTITKMFLTVNRTGYQFWVKPGANIKITGKAPYVQTWRTESDIPIPEQIELNRFREATQKEAMQIHDLTTEAMKILANADGKNPNPRQQFDSLRLKINSIHDEVILYKELQLMLKNPITLAGLEELRNAAKCYKEGKFNKLVSMSDNSMSLAGLNNLKETERSKVRTFINTVYSKLTDEQKQSQLGQEIISLLSISSTVKTGDKIYDAELKDVEGKIHHLSDYRGSYILLDFWSRACGPCVAALPELEKIAEQYKGKVIVISVSVDPVSVWKEEVAKSPVSNYWLQLSDGLGSSGIAAHYGLKSLPTFVYISPEGLILKIKEGYREDALLEELKSFIKD